MVITTLHMRFELICIGKFARRTWVNFTQQYGKNRQRCQQNKFTTLYGNYCYIFTENFPQKFSPCILLLQIFLKLVCKLDFSSFLKYVNWIFILPQIFLQKKVHWSILTFFSFLVSFVKHKKFGATFLRTFQKIPTVTRLFMKRDTYCVNSSSSR